MTRVHCSTIEEAVYYLTETLSPEMRRQIGAMEREQLDLLYEVLGRTIMAHLDLARNDALVQACRPRLLRRRFDELSQVILQAPGMDAAEREAFRRAFAEWRTLRNYLGGNASPPDTPAPTPALAADIILTALWEHLHV